MPRPVVCTTPWENLEFPCIIVTGSVWSRSLPLVRIDTRLGGLRHHGTMTLVEAKSQKPENQWKVRKMAGTARKFSALRAASPTFN